jgi:hypothetical protein
MSVCDISQNKAASKKKIVKLIAEDNVALALALPLSSNETTEAEQSEAEISVQAQIRQLVEAKTRNVQRVTRNRLKLLGMNMSPEEEQYKKQ